MSPPHRNYTASQKHTPHTGRTRREGLQTAGSTHLFERAADAVVATLQVLHRPVGELGAVPPVLHHYEPAGRETHIIQRGNIGITATVK